MDMNLKDTIEMMTSTDYKERFKAEYYQLAIRIDKLRRTVDNYSELPFKPACSKSLLNRQLSYMLEYKSALLTRADVEKIDL